MEEAGVKILVVEDDPDINRMVAVFLEKQGCRVTQAFSGTEGQLLLTMQEFDLAVMDLMLPGLSCLSHDIRTPLTGASGYLQLLWKEEDADRREEYFGIIRRRLSDLETLLEELFLFSKLNNADYRIACAYVDPFPVLCDVMAGFYDSLTQAGIEPVLEFAQMEGEEVLVYASNDALRRIFSNLLQNVLRYGGDRLRICQDGSKICFSNPVREGETLDTERIFDRFYRADGARGTTGTGLGLASVKGLMQKMGGDASAALARGGTDHCTAVYSCG